LWCPGHGKIIEDLVLILHFLPVFFGPMDPQKASHPSLRLPRRLRRKEPPTEAKEPEKKAR
jgi:hypothetical protein